MKERKTTKEIIIKESTFLTIGECQQLIRQLEPSTRITDYHIRKIAELGLAGEVPIRVLTSGKKKIINIKHLLKYFGMELTQDVFILGPDTTKEEAPQPENNSSETVNEPSLAPCPIPTVEEIPVQPTVETQIPIIEEKHTTIINGIQLADAIPTQQTTPFTAEPETPHKQYGESTF